MKGVKILIERKNRPYKVAIAEVRKPGNWEDVTFYRHKKNKKEWGTEVYRGENYIVGSGDKSYSRNYRKWKGLPAKYRPLAKKLRSMI